MFCPQCGAEYREGFDECSDCRILLADRLPEPVTPVGSIVGAQEEEDDHNVLADEGDLDVLVQTGLANPIAIGLAASLLHEAGIPFFAMDQNPTARQDSGNLLGWWNVRVTREREAEAREILRSVEEMR